MKTTLVREQDVTRQWRVVDAAGKPVGRLAVEICKVLRGKDRPDYTPHADMGDFIVVINASQAVLTGAKEDQKVYKRFSGYPGGLKLTVAREVRKRNPERMIVSAVKGMLPKNKLAVRQLKRMKVYAGADHPHQAQQPVAAV